MNNEIKRVKLTKEDEINDPVASKINVLGLASSSESEWE